MRSRTCSHDTLGVVVVVFFGISFRKLICKFTVAEIVQRAHIVMSGKLMASHYFAINFTNKNGYNFFLHEMCNVYRYICTDSKCNNTYYAWRAVCTTNMSHFILLNRKLISPRRVHIKFKLDFPSHYNCSSI